MGNEDRAVGNWLFPCGSRIDFHHRSIIEIRPVLSRRRRTRARQMNNWLVARFSGFDFSWDVRLAKIG